MDCALVGKRRSMAKGERKKGELNGGGGLTPGPKLISTQNGKSKHLGRLPGWSRSESRNFISVIVHV